ncbi:MAG: trypsin-like peptidase domain-containing protein [Candidatus Babeliales bacterium]|jgi:serine protease Do
MSKQNLLVTGFFFFIIIFFSVGGFLLFKRQIKLEEKLLMNRDFLPVGMTTDLSGGKPKVIEKIVSTAQLWRPVQEKVRDTVIQVFTQVAGIDLLQPYKPPMQGASCGSGFFINEQGDLITNAHVVNQAKSVWIQIPSLGKRIIDVEVVGISPERDLALLRVTSEMLNTIRTELGSIPYLSFGDSDLVRRSDEALALGYPLGQQSLKSTTGVISGREHHLIQTSAPINPGSSGGPLLNAKGEVIGINSAGITQAQNVGYAIPINDLKIVLPDLYKVKVLRKPFMGMLSNNGTEALTEYLQNPCPGGCYVVEVLKGSTFDTAGIRRGDMIYEINGYSVDIFGEMSVPWSEDKVSITDYASRLSIGENLNLVIYRNGERKELSVNFTAATLPAMRKIYPGYEEIDYEIFAGMVVMELTLNHIQLLGDIASGLSKYAELKNQAEQALVITHVFPNSQLFRSRTLIPGTTINEVNGMPVKTLDDFRQALRKGIGNQFLTILASDNVSRASDNVFVVLRMNKVLEEEQRLSQDYKYAMTNTAKELLHIADAQKAIST